MAKTKSVKTILDDKLKKEKELEQIKKELKKARENEYKKIGEFVCKKMNYNDCENFKKDLNDLLLFTKCKDLKTIQQICENGDSASKNLNYVFKLLDKHNFAIKEGKLIKINREN